VTALLYSAQICASRKELKAYQIGLQLFNIIEYSHRALKKIKGA